jgi:multidrug transporter EmrE-like cation transporter
MMAALFLFLLIAFESVADVFSKEYSLKGRLWLGAAALLFFLIANTCWLVSLRYKSQLAVGASIFCVAQGLAALLIGVWGYGETLTIQQYAGVALGIIALGLLVF